MRDTTGGITAKFLHTAARKDKSGVGAGRIRDCADKALDKLPIVRRKPLMPDDLSGPAKAPREMLMDVNKRARAGGWRCVSPIHRHEDSNLKNLRF
jgi:hypothetical protein